VSVAHCDEDLPVTRCTACLGEIRQLDVCPVEAQNCGMYVLGGTLRFSSQRRVQSGETADILYRLGPSRERAHGTVTPCRADLVVRSRSLADQCGSLLRSFATRSGLAFLNRWRRTSRVLHLVAL